MISPNNQSMPNALVKYDPTLPHISLKAHIEGLVNKLFQTSFEVMIYETKHIDPSRRLCQILPSINGPHRIGYSKFVLKVPDSETSRLCNKEIGIEIFSPTNNFYDNKVLLKMLPYTNGLNPKHPNYEKGHQLTESQIQTLCTNSFDLSEHDLGPVGSLPILIFSHGMGADPSSYRPLLEELASHGYIVLNLNHPASSGNALFLKEALNQEVYDEILNSCDEKFDGTCEKMAETGAANIRFVIEQIRAGRLEKLPKDCGPTSQIVLAGHSLGGASSIIAARENSQVSGCIDLDGALAGSEETRSTALSVPVLVIFTEHELHAKKDEDLKLFLKNSDPEKIIKKEILGVGHMDFTISPFLDSLVGEPTLEAGLKAYTIASQEMLHFMKGINNK